MREGNHTSSEHEVQNPEVTEQCNESGLEEQCEVRVVVKHTLLRDGQVTGLANHEIGPLYAHDGNKITGLGILESFSSVADLSFAEYRVAVESGCKYLITSHSACGIPTAPCP